MLRPACAQVKQGLENVDELAQGLARNAIALKVQCSPVRLSCMSGGLWGVSVSGGLWGLACSHTILGLPPLAGNPKP